jgi:photosystem II stability/assembly factor-like uncharacterized protein
MPTGERSSLNRIVSTSIAAAVLLVALVIAIGLFAGPNRNIGPSPLPVSTADASPTSAPTSTPAGEVMTFGDLESYDAHLFSDTVGWIQTDTSLYRTSDAGRTWSVVTMPRQTRPSTQTIVDGDTVFVAYAGSAWTLAATHDGGATWAEATIEGMPGDAFVIFAMRDATNGTATFDPGLQVYETGDGGKTWSGPTAGSRPSRSAIGCKFAPPPGDKGVISCETGKFDNRPFDDLLSLSTDGTRTWVELSFPTDEVSLAGEGKGLAGTPWIDGSHILLAVDNWTGSTAIYESQDDGRSWRLVHGFPNWQGSITFLAEADWVGCGNGTGASCWSTQDAGATWREARNGDLGWMFNVTFGTVDHAWGVIQCVRNGRAVSSASQCDGIVKSVLLETLDGGETWRPIG